MEIQLTDNTTPEGQWTFDEGVTTVFDNMFARSIPQYSTMRELVFTIAVSCATSVPKSTVVDLGCSRGESIAALRAALGSDACFMGIDSSEPMLAAARARFRGCDNVTMVETYEAMKAANGYTSEQIDRKRASLEGVLVPLTAAWNEDLLRQAGFRSIDCFWRWMNFAGWIVIRPD